MSGINVKTHQARATLRCDKCRAEWKSALYFPRKWGDEVRACEPAFSAGWRVFAGARSQRSYCPECKPTVQMILVHGRTPADSQTEAGDQ